MPDPRSKRRWPLLLMVLAAAAGVIASALFGPGAPKSKVADATPEKRQEPEPATPARAVTADVEPSPVATTAPSAPATPISQLRARNPGGTGAPASIGSLDPKAHRFRVDFSEGGAGVARVVFSDFWVSVQDREQARAHADAVARGDANPTPLPPTSTDTRSSPTARCRASGFRCSARARSR